MMRKLVASKPFKYGTRRLVPGEHFDAKSTDARILTAIRKAEYIDEGRAPASVPPMPERLRRHAKAASQTKQPARPPAAATPKVSPSSAAQLSAFDHDGDGNPGGSAAPPASANLTALRRSYEAKLGKRPFPGWDADELNRRMSEADAEDAS